MQDRLAGWKGRVLSLGGRAILINSIVNALPLHYMQAFLLPSWLLSHIDSIKRRFFWRGHASFSGGHCLVPWERICIPKVHGGLGILNLQNQNLALLLKWLWLYFDDRTPLWSSTLRRLHQEISLTTRPTSSFLFPSTRELYSLKRREMIVILSSLYYLQEPYTR